MKLHGWKRAGLAPVFEHVSGLRIHLHGLARMPDGELVDGTLWPLSQDVSRQIRIHGGNRKRGMMAWAKMAVDKAD